MYFCENKLLLLLLLLLLLSILPCHPVGGVLTSDWSVSSSGCL